MKWNFRAKLNAYTIAMFFLYFGREYLINLFLMLALSIWMVYEIYKDAEKNGMNKLWVLSIILGIIGPWIYEYYTPKGKEYRKNQKKYLFGLGFLGTALLILGALLLVLLLIIYLFAY